MNKKFSAAKQNNDTGKSKNNNCQEPVSMNFDKTCPLLNCPCLKEECQIYFKEWENCQFNILSYNLWKLHSALKDQSN
jgi:hypothetical protein